MEECSQYFCRNPKLHLDTVEPDVLVARAFKYKVTQKLLHRLEEERHLEVSSNKIVLFTTCMKVFLITFIWSCSTSVCG